MRRASLFLLLMALCMTVGAKERHTRVYMFGIALSFQDSVCVMTRVQTVDSAYISNEEFLKERTLYALQMENHLEAAGRAGATCVVFWDEKKQAAEKRYAKLRKKYESSGEFKLQDLEGFAFVREEHISTDDSAK